MQLLANIFKQEEIVFLLGAIFSGGFSALASLSVSRTAYVGSTQSKLQCPSSC